MVRCVYVFLVFIYFFIIQSVNIALAVDQTIPINILSSRLKAFTAEQIILEFDGQFIRKGELVYYHKQQKLIPVGSWSEGEEYPQLCQERWSGTCLLSIGQKYPDREESLSVEDKIVTLSFTLMGKEGGSRGAYKQLEAFVLSSPNQEEAGSCLYMASTGAMEILVNQLKGIGSVPVNEGSSDFSERFLMNVTNPSNPDFNWRTDTVLNFNEVRGGLLNQTYRFTKGWYKEDEQGEGLVKAKADDVDAKYDTYYNWIDELPKGDALTSKLIPVPLVDREILFKDTQNDVWNTGVMDDRVIDSIKKQIVKRDAPVLVIYNHFGYWHAVLIVGFDDNQISDGCSFVDRWITHMTKKYEEFLQSSNESYKNKGIRYKKLVDRVVSKKAIYGCSSKGVFQIRDSIYTGTADHIYDYDLTQTGEESPYSQKIVEKSYDWLKYLGNHAYVIFRSGDV